jgi:hypothetical protein
MAVPSIDLIERTFGALVDHPIWAPARSYTGGGTAKAPLNVHRPGEMAKTNDPSTWATLGEALAYNRKTFGGMGAVGIMSCPHPILNPERAAHRPHLAALDIDNGFRDGYPLTWAQMVLDKVSAETYIEISGSLTGAHVFGVVDSIPAEYLEPGTYGTSYYPPDAERADPNGKRPAIEASFGKSFTLLTGRVYGVPQPIRNITTKIPLILPRKRAIELPTSTLPIPRADPDGDVIAPDVEAAYRKGLTVEERNQVDALLARNADLRRAMLGDDWVDRSAALFASADLAKGYGMSLEQYVATIMVSTGAAAGHLNDQRDAMRAIARAWNRSPEPLRMASVPPVESIEDAAAPVNPSATTLTLIDMLDEKVSPPVTPPADLMVNPPKPQHFILEGMFPSTPIVLVGAGGQGKSALMLTLAILGLLGRPVWGHEWNGLGRVVYCTKEDSPTEVYYRLYRVLDALGIGDEEYRAKIKPRLYIENASGMAGATLVQSDRSGNMVHTAYTETLIDRYRGHDVGLFIVDPLNQFGPGESHGNDGAAAVLQVGWRLSRELRGELDGKNEDGKTCVCFISHMSIAAARDEVDDLHAARSAAAFGDNARAVFVVHRHKIDNPKGYIAPPDIQRDAIDEGRIMRLHSAKQNYALNPMVPFYIERRGWGFNFHDPLTLQEVQDLQRSAPSPAAVKKHDETAAALAALRAMILSRTDSFTAAIIRSAVSRENLPLPSRLQSAVPAEIEALLREGKLKAKGDAYSVVRPEVEF